MDKNEQVINAQNVDELYKLVYDIIICDNMQTKVKIAQSIIKSSIVDYQALISFEKNYDNFRVQVTEEKLFRIILILNEEFNYNIDTSLLNGIDNQKQKEKQKNIVFNFGYKLNIHEYVCYAKLIDIVRIVADDRIFMYYEKISRSFIREKEIKAALQNENIFFDPIRFNINTDDIYLDIDKKQFIINSGSLLSCVRGKLITSVLYSFYLSGEYLSEMIDTNICVIVSDYQSDIIASYLNHNQYIETPLLDFDESASKMAMDILTNDKLDELVKNRVHIRSDNAKRDVSRGKITHSTLAKAIYLFFKPNNKTEEEKQVIVDFIIRFYNEFARINYDVFQSLNQDYSILNKFSVGCEIYMCSLIIEKQDINLHEYLLRYNYIFKHTPNKGKMIKESVSQYVNERMK